MTDPKTEAKLACLLMVARLMIQIPLSAALMFLVLRHIDATDLMWLLFWITLPLSFGISVVAEAVQKRVKGKGC